MATINLLSLPPGFGFHPTDVELVCHYLKGKILGHELEFEVIPEVDIYKHEPWDLPEKSSIPVRNSTWHFFTSCDRKYPNGTRSNRATERGYWKSTGKDRNINSRNRVVGTKKTLVFHEGRPPRGVRSPWIMHEYHLNKNECEAAPGMKDAFVLCRVFNKDGLNMENEEVGSEQVERIDCVLEEDPCLAVRPVAQLEGAQWHNLEVAGSNPGSIPAYVTNKDDLNMENEEVGSEQVERIDCVSKEDPCLAIRPVAQLEGAQWHNLEVAGSISGSIPAYVTEKKEDPCFALDPINFQKQLEERSVAALEDVASFSSSELEAWLEELSAPNSVDIPPTGELSYKTMGNANSLALKQDPAVAISCALPNTSDYSMSSNNPYPLHSELEDSNFHRNLEYQFRSPEFDSEKLLRELNFDDEEASPSLQQDPAVAISCALPNTSDYSMSSNNPYPLHSELEDSNFHRNLEYQFWSPEFDSEKLLRELNFDDEEASPSLQVNSDEVRGDIFPPVFTGGNMQDNTRTSNYNDEDEFVDDQEEKSNSVSLGLADNSIGTGIQICKRNGRKSLNKVPNQRIRLQIHKMEARNVDLVETCTYEDQTVEFVVSGCHLNSKSDCKSDSDQNFLDKSISSGMFSKQCCDATKDLSKSEQTMASPVLDQTTFEIKKGPVSGKLLQASFSYQSVVSEAEASSRHQRKTVDPSEIREDSGTCNYNEKKWIQALRWISVFSGNWSSAGLNCLLMVTCMMGSAALIWRFLEGGSALGS